MVEASGAPLVTSALFSGECLTADGRIPWAPDALRALLPPGSLAIVPGGSPPGLALVLARVDHAPFVTAELDRLAALDAGGASPTAGAPRMTTTGKRILIAEDETIIRLDLRATLEASGYDVCGEARDGVEAVELAEELEPDVILMDVKMPRLDGIEAARRILERRAVPIVMLTAFGQEELVARAVDTGVFGYLAKPFREQDVIPALVAARARHAEFAEVKLQATSLLEALEARKAIERAKGILMAKEGITEDEAFARLRRASQKSGRPMKVIADAVAATLG